MLTSVLRWLVSLTPNTKTRISSRRRVDVTKSLIRNQDLMRELSERTKKIQSANSDSRLNRRVSLYELNNTLNRANSETSGYLPMDVSLESIQHGRHFIYSSNGRRIMRKD